MKANKGITKSIEFVENGLKNRLVVEYGLHYIKGNHAPYFSITATQYEQRKDGQWLDVCGGCMHDEIRKRFPRLRPIIALHLSDMDGQPMYAHENGWYWYKESPQKAADYLRLVSLPSGLNKSEFDQIVDDHKATWKQEAESVIKKFGLCVYGDKWEPAN